MDAHEPPKMPFGIQWGQIVPDNTLLKCYNVAINNIYLQSRTSRNYNLWAPILSSMIQYW